MLEWECLGGTTWRAPAPLFGSIRVEDYDSGEWMVYYSVPGYCNELIADRYPSPQQAKAAADEIVASRMRSFLRIESQET